MGIPSPDADMPRVRYIMETETETHDAQAFNIVSEKLEDSEEPASISRRCWSSSKRGSDDDVRMCRSAGEKQQDVLFEESPEELRSKIQREYEQFSDEQCQEQEP